MDRGSRTWEPESLVVVAVVDVGFVGTEVVVVVVAERFVAVAVIGIGLGFVDDCSCSNRIFVCLVNDDWAGERVFLG